MIDLVYRASRFLAESGYEAHVKRLDEFTGREGIVLRRIPSAVTERYFDGGEAVSYVYQVIVRRRSERRAMEECCDIAELLKDAWLDSENGSYAFEGQEIYTEPQELALEETGFYAWETRIKASITR